MSRVDFSHDTDANAVYVRVDGDRMDGHVIGMHTEQVHPQVNLDLGPDGDLIGVEIFLAAPPERSIIG